MKTFMHEFTSNENLTSFLDTDEFTTFRTKAESILVQIFTAKNEKELLTSIIETLKSRIPDIMVAGTTTVGEVEEGELKLGKILLSFSLFEQTKLKRVHCCCDDIQENEAGDMMMQQILMSGEKIAGVMIFSTPLTVDIAKVFQRMSRSKFDFKVFGGGAGIYDASRTSAIFTENLWFEKGLLAVIFLGDQLVIDCRSNLGWMPLSQEMTITKAEGMVVRQVDDINGFELYHKYLGIKNDSNFFQNVLEFPFLIERDGYTIARVPFFAHEDNSIEFVSDIHEGERFRIGYGDPDTMIQNSEDIRKSMLEFQPEAIFLYACICRRFLLQTDVNREIVPFNCIAPTSGFFTYGEFYATNNEIKLLNASIVVVGMKELGSTTSGQEQDRSLCAPVSTDLYSDKHNRIISHLLHFIRVLSDELEDANKELVRLSEIDKTTMIYNRRKLDGILEREMQLCKVQKTRMTVAILDIDHYKIINDKYGHLTGDKVLVELAELLLSSIRRNDFVGRWGGEEFLLILPLADVSSALGLAERVRKEIEEHVFNGDIKGGLHLTCSLGVASFKPDDTMDRLLGRADRALYEAKEKGRNRVMAAD